MAKDQKTAARKRQAKLLKKRTKDKERHRALAKSGVALSENAVQHQMLSEFGSPQNFLKNVLALAGMMQTEPDLKALRFPAEQVYAHFDLAADREALADAYEKKDAIGVYDEKHHDFWRGKRRAALKDLVTDEFVERCEKTFRKLMVAKRGFKKEYRAALAGLLLTQSQKVALSPTEAPLEDNNLWELILLATIKDNPRELPPPAPPTSPAEAAAEPPPAP
jgi:hypothetical protein